MSSKFIKTQVDFIAKNAGITDIYEVDRIRYGMESFYFEFSKMLIIFLVSCFINCVEEFFIVTLFIFGVRTLIGGTHANSYLSCLFQTSTLFGLVYLLSNLFDFSSLVTQILILIPCICFIIFTPPVISTPRPKSTYEKAPFYKKLSLTFVISYFIISNLFSSNSFVTCGLIILILLILDNIRGQYLCKKNLHYTKSVKS